MILQSTATLKTISINITQFEIRFLLKTRQSFDQGFLYSNLI